MEWIPAFSTTSLLSLALWLSRSVITNRLTKSVQHEFDLKIESLRANLRKSEESFKSDLRAKETQIEVLRSGAISGLASRQMALDKRRIEAVDQLWSAVTDLAPAKTISGMISPFNFDLAAKEASKNPQFREIFSGIEGAFNLKNNQGTQASKARPFVSQLAWAIFSAYQAIVYFSVVKLYMLKAGLDAPNILKVNHITELIEVVLPHQVEYIKKYGESSYHYLLEELESRLLEELHNILQGVESDKASVEQAAKILKEAEKVMGSISTTTTPS